MAAAQEERRLLLNLPETVKRAKSRKDLLDTVRTIRLVLDSRDKLTKDEARGVDA